MMSETRGKKLGTLHCCRCKPPAIRGHAAAFKYWFNAFGHTGPYSQKVEVVNGIQTIIPKGNPMECPGNIMFCHSNVLNDLVFFIVLVLFSNSFLKTLEPQLVAIFHRTGHMYT